MGRLPRAKPEPRLAPKEGTAAGGALTVSGEATVGSPDVVTSDMLFFVLLRRAPKRQERTVYVKQAEREGMRARRLQAVTSPPPAFSATLISALRPAVPQPRSPATHA